MRLNDYILDRQWYVHRRKKLFKWIKHITQGAEPFIRKSHCIMCFIAMNFTWRPGRLCIKIFKTYIHLLGSMVTVSPMILTRIRQYAYFIFIFHQSSFWLSAHAEFYPQWTNHLPFVSRSIFGKSTLDTLVCKFDRVDNCFYLIWKYTLIVTVDHHITI